VLTALLGGLAWWAWVLLIAVGLVVGLVWAVRRGRAITPDPAGEPAG
jgi:hypothetical protein